MLKRCSGCLLVMLISLFLPLFVQAADIENSSTLPEESAESEQTSEIQSAEKVDTTRNRVDSNPSDVTAASGMEGEPREEEFVEEETVADPLEPLNRLFFTFNDRLYFWVMKPAAKGYNAVVPEWGRVRVRNVFYNVLMPVRFVNSLLQLKIKAAGIELTRFLVNSTYGIGGMFDIASENLVLKKKNNKDLGQTLGFYGIGNGFFMVWPFLGPSSVRDTAGLIGDSFLDPVNYLSPGKAIFAIHAYDKVNDTSLRIGEYEDLKESAVDPYIAVRDAYIQYRNNEIKK